jgi:3-hydroxyethyl bacteriochlorophyllide a dehydrogenase
MDTLAVVVERPEQLSLRHLPLSPPQPDEVMVDVEWSGISTGTERLLWSGRMPHFPGMGYPLVPGYESVGRVSAPDLAPGRAWATSSSSPARNCFGEVRGLFGGAASRLVVPADKVVPRRGSRRARHPDRAGRNRASTPSAPGCGATAPGLIVGHGVLGRLLARESPGCSVARRPTVWESNPARAVMAPGLYDVVDPPRTIRVATTATIVRRQR